MNEQYVITTGDLTKEYGETTAVGISNSPSQPGPCTGFRPERRGKNHDDPHSDGTH